MEITNIDQKNEESKGSEGNQGLRKGAKKSAESQVPENTAMNGTLCLE